MAIIKTKYSVEGMSCAACASSIERELSKKEGIIYVTQEGAVKKEEFEEIIRNNFEDKKITVYKLDLTNIEKEEREKFINANEFTDESFTIPMILYIKEGIVVDSIQGYAPDYKVKELIEKNNIE